MEKDCFRFKQFEIRQEKCAMKVGTDGVLLGGWVDATGEIDVLDVGCGSGLIALMIAQRTKGRIDAVEIDEDSASQAEQNFRTSPWSNRLNLINAPFQVFARNAEERYDLIVSNPPFFETGIRANNQRKAFARHADGLPFEDLLRFSSQLLKMGGRIALIIPFSQRKKILSLTTRLNLWLLREANVKANEHEGIIRVLLELSTDMPLKYSLEEIIIEEEKRHKYSPSFMKYTKDYYLDEHSNI